MSRGWACISWLLPLAFGLAALAHAQVYQWVDGDGVTHYTVERSDAERRLRSRLRGDAAPHAWREAPRAVLRREPLAPEAELLPEPPLESDAGIRELEAQIARDRATLKEMISDGGGGVDLATDPRVREIAERLPRLQSELDALRREAER